jgi:hypothetical protein
MHAASATTRTVRTERPRYPIPPSSAANADASALARQGGRLIGAAPTRLAAKTRDYLGGACSSGLKRLLPAWKPVLGRPRARVRRRVRTIRAVDISSLLPTPGPATTAAREVVIRYSSAALANHCQRSYLWSASLGRLKRIPYDADLLYVAAMLHDLGLVPAFDNHLAPFEDAGGDVGWVFGAAAGWPAGRRDRVKEIIVRHMWREVDPALDAEGHLLREGTALDIGGRNVDAWPAGFRAEVLRRHPRLTLVTEFTAAFDDQARRKPGCAAAAAVASGIGARLASNPLDH